MCGQGRVAAGGEVMAGAFAGPETETAACKVICMSGEHHQTVRYDLRRQS